MDLDAIRAQLDRGQREFPFPAGEMKRLAARRWIFNHVPRGGVGAEIGVFRGHFSELICEVLAPRKLYLIDPWTRAGEIFGWGADYTLDGTLPTALARDEARLRTALYPAVETVLVEDRFPDCAGLITEPLDWLYLDASHHFAPTLNELRAAADLLKPEGVIFGDDWKTTPKNPRNKVREACHAFLRESDFEIIAAGPGGQWCMRRGCMQCVSRSKALMP